MTSPLRRRVIAAIVSLAVAGPGLAALIGVEHDDYPLSTYPMFAFERPQRTVLSGAQVVAADGTTRRLDPTAISGSAEPLQAKAVVDRALDGDPAALCSAMLGRVDLDDDEVIELFRDRVDAIAHYTDGDPAPERVKTIACSGPAR